MSEQKPKVFLQRYGEPREVAQQILKQYFDFRVGTGPYDEEKIIQEIKDADAIMGGGERDFPLTRSVLESTSKLKIIGVYGAGVEGIDLEAATDLGIIVSRSPVANVSVAEAAIFLMTGVLRGYRRIENYLYSGEWGARKGTLPRELLGHQLSGKTVGIIGLGRIGAHLSKMLKGAYDARVLAYDPYVSSERAAEVGAELVDLETLLKTSDVVSVCSQLTPETSHMINEKRLRLMKPTAIIVNTARGDIIDEKALQTALEKEWIAGAGLDVWDPEPPKLDNPLLKMANVFVTPHVTGATWEARAEIQRRTSMNMVDVLIERRAPPDFCIVNPKVLKSRALRAKLK